MPVIGVGDDDAPAFFGEERFGRLDDHSQNTLGSLGRVTPEIDEDRPAVPFIKKIETFRQGNAGEPVVQEDFSLLRVKLGDCRLERGQFGLLRGFLGGRVLRLGGWCLRFRPERREWSCKRRKEEEGEEKGFHTTINSGRSCT